MTTQSNYEKELTERRKNDAVRARAALAKLRDVAKALGWSELPPKYKRDEPLGHFDASADIEIASEDMVLMLRANGYDNDGRISVRVRYPKPKKGDASDYGLPQPSITVSLEKSAEKIAHEIGRRLMPEYLEGMTKARARNNGTENYHNTREKSLRLVLGRDLTESEIKDGRTNFEGVYLGKCSDMYDSSISAVAKADGDGEVTLELSYIPAALALKVIELLKKEAR